jgi:hypothetical protein
MSDSKYGRLYPERAVAPLTELLMALCDKITATPTATQTVITHAEILAALNACDRQGFPEDEPLFLLRGQDVLTPPIVRQYAEDAAAEGAHGIGTGEPEGQAAFDHMMEQADAMAAWQPRKLPD